LSYRELKALARRADRARGEERRRRNKFRVAYGAYDDPKT
jgi:hypothetical protein